MSFKILCFYCYDTYNSCWLAGGRSTTSTMSSQTTTMVSSDGFLGESILLLIWAHSFRSSAISDFFSSSKPSSKVSMKFFTALKFEFFKKIACKIDKNLITWIENSFHFILEITVSFGNFQELLVCGTENAKHFQFLNHVFFHVVDVRTP